MSANITIRDLSKHFQGERLVKAVDDVNLTIKEGTFTTLLGPSGCGKTTMLRMIAGFEEPTSGEIYIDNKEVSGLSPDKRDTSMVFQNYALFPHLNVYDNIAYGLKLQKLSDEEIRARVQESMEIVNLEGYENRNPSQLSGGQQQRVALARALIMKPSVLLFDEPLSNLDAKLRIFMRNEIRRIQQTLGITAIYVTHDQSEAMSLSDQIVIMNQGKIEQVGTPQSIYERPLTSFVADFIGQSNIIDIMVDDCQNNIAQFNLGDTELKIPASSDVRKNHEAKLILRPETLNVCEHGEIKGEVISSVYMGSYQDYSIQIGDGLVTVHEFNPDLTKIYKPGDSCYVKIDLSKAFVVSK